MKNSFIKLTMLLAAVVLSCQKPVPVVNVTGINLVPAEITLKVGASGELDAVVSPDNATDKRIKWNTSNVDVVYVSDGKLLGLSAGEALVSATTLDGGFKAECKVTVIKDIIHVSSISVTPQTLALEEGENTTLNATVLPVNADDRGFTWSSSNRDIATVDDNGRVNATKAGEAIITATANDGGLKATCAVTVDIVRPKSVSLDVTQKAMFKGESFTLTATVLPANAQNKGVKWHSSDPTIASVENGKVTAVAKGQTTVIVTTLDGGLTASCDITVSNAGDFSGGNEGYEEIDLN